MANATLVIHKSKAFANDIWQYEADFTKLEWSCALKTMSDVVCHAKKVLEKAKIEEFEDDEIYQLGDVINFFINLGLNVER